MSKVFFFGYGSLMYPRGVNGRGMRHRYTKDDIFPAELQGYRRDMLAENGQWTFYGVVRSEDHHMNGTIMPINSEYDLEALLINEGARPKVRQKPMYLVEDITDKIACDHIDIKGAKILTLIKEKVGRGTPYPGYCENVFKGIQYHGEEFVRKFLDTGGRIEGYYKGLNLYYR